jgi:hypothetical protein
MFMEVLSTFIMLLDTLQRNTNSMSFQISIISLPVMLYPQHLMQSDFPFSLALSLHAVHKCQ